MVKVGWKEDRCRQQDGVTLVRSSRQSHLIHPEIPVSLSDLTYEYTKGFSLLQINKGPPGCFFMRSMREVSQQPTLLETVPIKYVINRAKDQIVPSGPLFS